MWFEFESEFVIGLLVFVMLVELYLLLYLHFLDEVFAAGPFSVLQKKKLMFSWFASLN